MGSGFKRSRLVAFIGIPVVAIVTAGIGLAADGGEYPKGAIALILAIVFGFLALLFYVQRRDLDQAAAADQRAAATAPPGPIADAGSVDPAALAAALAVRPVDSEALAARGATWEIGRSSIRSGAVMSALILVAVVPWLIFQFIWSIVIVVPVIMGYALFLSGRLLAGGGTVDQAFDASAAMMVPLGLEMTSRPKVALESRFGQPGYDTELRGATAFAGERHGRPVAIRSEDGDARTTVAAAVPQFEVRYEKGRLRARPGAPAEVGKVLGSLSASDRWKGVEVAGGPDGIVVERERDGGSEWLYDLWLAERLADRLAP